MREILRVFVWRLHELLRIVSDEHWQRAAAADPPQPIEHCIEHQQDRQRAHRPVGNGSGRTLATRSRIEENDPAAMNSSKHIRHRWRVRRGPPRGTPNRMMRTSPIAAMIVTAARKENIGCGSSRYRQAAAVRASASRDILPASLKGTART
jgi:hypothetical protein